MARYERTSPSRRKRPTTFGTNEEIRDQRVAAASSSAIPRSPHWAPVDNAPDLLVPWSRDEEFHTPPFGAPWTTPPNLRAVVTPRGIPRSPFGAPWITSRRARGTARGIPRCPRGAVYNAFESPAPWARHEEFRNPTRRRVHLWETSKTIARQDRISWVRRVGAAKPLDALTDARPRPRSKADRTICVVVDDEAPCRFG